MRPAQRNVSGASATPAAPGRIRGVNLLAFEAATSRLSVALYRDGTIVENSAEVPNGGSERLLPWAHELLAGAGLSLRQLDGLAFGAGPGGFTGLRLACGVVQGLAFGLDRSVVPVGTLAALALASGEGRIIACLDARMDEVYLAAFEVRGETVEEVLAPTVGAGDTAVLPEGEGWRGAGDGFATSHGAAIVRRMGPRLAAADAQVFPTAAAVARLAAPVLATGGGVPAAQALPLYVRDKVALTTAERRARGGVR